MHQVHQGAAAKSYGIQVASLAGIPKSVLTIAKKYLKELETNTLETKQLDLFSIDFTEDVQIPQPQIKNSQLLDMLNAIEPDLTTPKDALDLLYKLKELIKL